MVHRPQYIIEKVSTVEVTQIEMAIGSGVPRDPYRYVTEWWFDGRLLSRSDPYVPPEPPAPAV